MKKAAERSEKPRRAGVLGVIGAISMCIPDFGATGDVMDDFIASVRAEGQAFKERRA